MDFSLGKLVFTAKSSRNPCAQENGMKRVSMRRFLANYVAASHDPFNTTDNNDGRLSNQLGINERFGTTLIDRYSSFFPMRPNDAVFISDPTDYAFEACLRSHSWLETILFADRNSRRGLNS